MGREVSESCVDSLITEMVSSYCDRFYANKPDLAAHRIEAIGFQVGLQLSERFRMQLEDLRIVKCGLEEVVALEDGAQKQ